MPKQVKKGKQKARKTVRKRYVCIWDVISEKLNPARFPSMSPKMMAIVAYITGERYTTPHIESMVKTSDGMVLARQSGDNGYNTFIGHISEVDSNWNRLLESAELTPEEEKEAMLMYKGMIRRF
jgi:hypothetical protein